MSSVDQQVVLEPIQQCCLCLSFTLPGLRDELLSIRNADAGNWESLRSTCAYDQQRLGDGLAGQPAEDDGGADGGKQHWFHHPVPHLSCEHGKKLLQT
jgi:hypothetical protein